MMKKKMIVTLATVMTALTAAAPMSAFAAAPGATGNVDETTTQAEAQSQVSLNKTEAVTPTFTVDVPATITLGKDATTLKYSMNLENHDNFIPTGKKVSVKITSAGYPGTLNKFALWDKKGFNEASYEIIDSLAMANPTVYQIGDEIASWEGSNWGTQTRIARVKDYNSLEAGTYEGVINYSISLENK